MNRIDKLCAYLDKCNTFADVGCDHGYCTLYMLKNGMCKTAVISDISAKCLEKAEKLLAGYIKDGKVKSVCCQGLDKIDWEIEQVLIAGMGGEEIVSILKSSFIPEKFVLQPMKNVRLVREYLLLKGASIERDEAFLSDGKFYFVLKGKRDGAFREYKEYELEFGQAPYKADTKEYLLSELNKKYGYLSRPLGEEAKKKITAEIEQIKDVLENEHN